MEVLKGAYDAFLGKELNFSLGDISSAAPKVKVDAEASANIKYGYCTEFIILLTKHFNIKHEMDKSVIFVHRSVVEGRMS